MATVNGINNKDFERVVLRSFTSSGTYTPTVGMKYCIVELWGPGGGGPGSDTTTAGQMSAGGGGAGGNYTRNVFSASAVGASQTITIGAGGIGGTTPAGAGGAGGETSFGGIQTAKGGNGGSAMAATSTQANAAGGTTGANTVGGALNITGQPGGYGFALATSTMMKVGDGGAPGVGTLNPGVVDTGTNISNSGNSGPANTGKGGCAGRSAGTGGPATGGAGGSGRVLITEFVSP